MHDRRCPVTALCVGVLVMLHVPRGAGQGRLQMPLGRSSVWRAGLDTPKNYDDHMLECGGLWYKKKRNNQCGLCGDPVDKARDNEIGGKFDSGIITGSYAPGQRALLKVLMNSNYGGYMEFKLCPNRWASQDCFDKHPIYMADGSGTRYYLREGTQGVVNVHVRMPDITCRSCIMQWTYTGSSEWGFDEFGQQCDGCGPQYELRNCADIALTSGRPGNLVTPEIERYNQGEAGGQNPLGSYYFDPTLKTRGSHAPQSRSPYAPPSRQTGGDPWLNGNQSPPRRQPTTTNRWPYAPPSRRDPWLNNLRSPTVNQRPPSRQTPRRNQSPYAPPQSGGSPGDPWTGRRRGPTSNQSPPRRQPSKRGDPWIRPRSPVVNRTPPRKDNDYDVDNRAPYAPPGSGNNLADPRRRGSNAQQRQQSTRYPYAPPTAQNSLRVSPSRRQKGYTPMSSINDNNNDKNNNNDRDPWIIPRTPNNIKLSYPRDTDSNKKYIGGGGGDGDGGGGDVPVPAIQKITVLENQTLVLPPRLTCVAQDEDGASSSEGMDQWCTENCNLDYCPQHLCSCW